ncbi:MAG: abortive phage infection protein [Bacilli bacterium]|nr:abortive phage infection protein [Bacilli bacterium]
MKEKTNYEKLEKIFKKNGGFITRQDVDDAKIPSWFLSDFVKRKNLSKKAPGYYVADDYTVDDYFILQRRYPKYIFSGMSALYLLGLTDKIPTDIEVAAPQSYHPSRNKMDSILIRRISSSAIYGLGIKETKTMFGNVVRVYDEERTICDLIKYREKYDAETFIKAIKLYIRKKNDQRKLFEYAKKIGIEKRVYEVVEVVVNAD